MHEGHRERLKNRFFTHGLDGFAPHEVLELLLTFAIPQRDVNPIAHQLIDTFGSFSGVLNASPEELRRVPGIGVNASALLSLMPQLMGYYQRDGMRERPVLRSFTEKRRSNSTSSASTRRASSFPRCSCTRARLTKPWCIRGMWSRQRCGITPTRC